MAGETQATPTATTTTSSRRGYAGAAFGVLVGGVAGWVLGRAVTMAPANGLGATVAGVGVTLGVGVTVGVGGTVGGTVGGMTTCTGTYHP